MKPATQSTNSILLPTLLVVAVSVFSSCGNKGGGGNSNDNKTAAIPGPQGVVTAQGDSSTQCNFVNGTFNCTSPNIYAAQSGQTCQVFSQSYTYTDISTLCQRLQEAETQLTTSQCGNLASVTQILTTIRTQNNCAPITPIVNQQLPIIDNTNRQDSSYKIIECDIEAHRSHQHGGFLHLTSNADLPSTKVIFNVMNNTQMQKFDFQSRVGRLFDIGKFGRTTVTYLPADRLKNKSEMLVLNNDGLNGNLKLCQAGVAGDEVRMDVSGEDGRDQLSLSVSCRGRFSINSVTKVYTKYVCTGQSRLNGADDQKVNVTFPIDSNFFNRELDLAEGLVLKVESANSSIENARVTFMAQGVSDHVNMISSSRLKGASAGIKTSNSHGDLVNVSCVLQ